MISKIYISGIALSSFLSFLLLSCDNGEPKLENPFRVKVINSDYSLAYSTIYELDMDTIKITFSGHVEGEVDTIVYRRQLSTEEKRRVAAFFSKFPLASLKNEYINPNVDDGDQKLFEIVIGSLSRTIQTSNYYETHLGNLVNLLNALIDDKYKISYEGLTKIE